MGFSPCGFLELPRKSGAVPSFALIALPGRVSIIMRDMVCDKIARKPIFLALLFVLCVAAVVVWHANRRAKSRAKKGMIIPFTRVQSFSRSAALVSSYFGGRPILMDVSGKDAFAHRLSRDKNPVSSLTSLANGMMGKIGPTPIAVRLDGSRLYLCLGKMLVECDASGQVLRQISIDEFDLGSGSFLFARHAQASINRLWLSVFDLEHEIPGERYFVVEWQPDKPPGTRVVGPRFNYWFAADPTSRKVLVSGYPTGIFDFSTKEFIEIKRGTFHFVDFDSQHGFLLSISYPSDRGDAAIIRVDAFGRSTTVLPNGMCAFWGPDDHIYFCRGETQLWRCRPDGSEVEPVYLATTNPIGGRRRSAALPVFSHDRTFVAYLYRVPRVFGGDIRGVVLIDLKSNEYCELPATPFFYERIAWVTKNDVIPELEPENILAGPSDLDPTPIVPIYEAVLQGNVDYVKKLLMRGLDINAKNSIGHTALHKAVLLDTVDMAQLLLSNGADVSLTDNRGSTPLDMARRKGSEDAKAILQLLKRHRKLNEN